MLDGFSATLEKIYAAAGDFRRWDEALRAVESLTGSAGAVMDLVPRRPHVAPAIIAGSFGIEDCQTYARDYMGICPRIRFGLDHPRGTQFDYLFMTEAEMDRDPVYAWFGSHGLRYHVGAWVGQTPNYQATFSLQRSRRQGHAGEADIALFELLKPHAARALSLADQLGTLHAREKLGTTIVEALPQAVFAIADDGQVVQVNGAALGMIRKGDGLGIGDGLLKVKLAGEQEALDRLIHEAAGVEFLAASGWTRVSRTSGAAPYAVFVAPLPVIDEALTIATAKVIVIVHDPTARPMPDPAMLTQIYGLTETEARLAGAIALGHSLESAAELLGMRVGTARSHLKSVFAKLGVNRQQDLVRILVSLSSIRFAGG